SVVVVVVWAASSGPGLRVRPLLLVLPPQPDAGVVDRRQNCVPQLARHALAAVAAARERPVRRVHVPRVQVRRPGRVAAGRLGRSTQRRRHADRHPDLVGHVTDLHADRAVALPPPRVGRALALLALGGLLGPVLVAQPQDLDRRRLLDRPRVHAAVDRDDRLAARDRGLDRRVRPLGGLLLLARLVVQAGRAQDRRAVLDRHGAVRVPDQRARAGVGAVLGDADRRGGLHGVLSGQGVLYATLGVRQRPRAASTRATEPRRASISRASARGRTRRWQART